MRNLFSVLLVMFVLGAWGGIFYRNITVANEYENNCAKAREAYEKGYYLEALSWLDKAEEIESNYETICLKRDTYKKMGDTENYIGFCRQMIQAYPDEADNYVAVMEYARDNENFAELVEKLSLYADLFPDNQRLQELSEELIHRWQMIQTGYLDVQYVTQSLSKIRKTGDILGEKEGRIKYTLINNEGSDIFDYDYRDITISWDKGSAMVCDQEGIWTRVSVSNQLLARNEDVQFDRIGSLSQIGIATAVINGKYRFINPELKVAAPEWDDAATFSEGINAVSLNGKWAIVDQDNWSSITDYPYMDVARNRYDLVCVEGRIVAADSQGYFLMDQELNPVSQQRHEEIRAFESAEPTAYREGEKWGFLSRADEIVIAPQYEDALPFVNGYAAVKRDGLWGYINLQGEMIAEPQFVEAQSVRSNGVAYVRNAEGYWDYIVIYMLYYQS